MSFVIESVLDVILSIFIGTFQFLAESFIECFGINIGANFSSISSSSQEKTVSLANTISSYVAGNDTSLFSSMFPLNDYKVAFATLGVAIATLIFVLELIKVTASPVIGKQKDHPGTLLGKYALSLVGIIMSYRILIIVEYTANLFYIQFAKIALGNIEKSAAGTITISQGFSDYFSYGTVISDVAGVFISACLAGMLLMDFLKLMIEIVERYVVMGFLFFSSPVAFSTLASTASSNIFASWCKMFASEALLMITNSMFVGVFIQCIVSFSEVDKGMPWMIYGIMLVAWLKLGQRFDTYLNTLGLNTLTTGGQVSAAVGAFIGSTAGRFATKMAGKATGKGIEAGKNVATRGFNGFKDAVTGSASTSAQAAQVMTTKNGTERTTAQEASKLAKAHQAGLYDQMKRSGIPNADAINQALNGGERTPIGNSGPVTRNDLANALNLNDSAKAALNKADHVSTDGDGRIKMAFPDDSTLSIDTCGRNEGNFAAFGSNNVCSMDVGDITAGANGSNMAESIAKDIVNGANAVNPDGSLNNYAKGYMAAEKVRSEIFHEKQISSNIRYHKDTGNYEVYNSKDSFIITPTFNDEAGMKIPNTSYRKININEPTA